MMYPMRSWKRFHTTLREWKMVAKTLLSQHHPMLAHIIPMRRCNLSCTYCNEFDDHSEPVSTETMNARVDRLAELNTSIVTISGGEPLMHSELERIITQIRRRNMIAGLITNGYLLSRGRIRSLNDSGLEHLQISIDNVNPDETSKKSLKVLDKKLLYLAKWADFKININSVLGSGVSNPEDALEIGHRAVELGFTCTVGLIHDGKGALKPLSGPEREAFFELRRLGKKSYARVNKYFQDNLVNGKPNGWRCRAGGRYLYVCEDGLVHYCSQQRGYPGIPIEEYDLEDIKREYLTEKSCAPTCTISCVHHASIADWWRAPQTMQAFKQDGLPKSTSTSSAMGDLLQLD
ncbi:MAG: radical SAM protein [Acidobacteriota bacterium]|nr:radical SAM protein [Acidobacteriota bacterium]